MDVVPLRDGADHVVGLPGFLHGHSRPSRRSTTSTLSTTAPMPFVARVAHIAVEAGAHVVAVDPAELAQQFLRALVQILRDHDPDFDDQIAAAAVARRRNPALAQPEALAGLGARR